MCWERIVEDCQTELLAKLWVVGKRQVSWMEVERRVLILSFQKREGIREMERIGGFVKVVTDELDPQLRIGWDRKSLFFLGQKKMQRWKVGSSEEMCASCAKGICGSQLSLHLGYILNSLQWGLYPPGQWLQKCFHPCLHPHFTLTLLHEMSSDIFCSFLFFTVSFIKNSSMICHRNYIFF